MIDLNQWNCKILFRDLEMLDSSEHGGVVVIQLWSFILKSDKLEALTTNMAPVNRSLS